MGERDVMVRIRLSTCVFSPVDWRARAMSACVLVLSCFVVQANQDAKDENSDGEHVSIAKAVEVRIARFACGTRLHKNSQLSHHTSASHERM